jgi:hypothetical protein
LQSFTEYELGAVGLRRVDEIYARLPLRAHFHAFLSPNIAGPNCNWKLPTRNPTMQGKRMFESKETGESDTNYTAEIDMEKTITYGSNRCDGRREGEWRIDAGEFTNSGKGDP